MSTRRQNKRKRLPPRRRRLYIAKNEHGKRRPASERAMRLMAYHMLRSFRLMARMSKAWKAAYDAPGSPVFDHES